MQSSTNIVKALEVTSTDETYKTSQKYKWLSSLTHSVVVVVAATAAVVLVVVVVVVVKVVVVYYHYCM